MVMRQSGTIDSSQRVHIYSADMHRNISLQFYPDGYDLVEPQPVLVSEGYVSPACPLIAFSRSRAHAMIAQAGRANMALLAGGFNVILSVCLDLMHRRNTQQCISFWQPVAPPGYLPLGHVPSIGLDPPPRTLSWCTAMIPRRAAALQSSLLESSTSFGARMGAACDHVGAAPATRLQSVGDCGGPRCRAARQQRGALHQRGSMCQDRHL